MDPPIIETKALQREFGSTLAVEALDLRVQPGEIFGLVGPDGAGKTTVLRLLAGLLDLTSGSARVAGLDLRYQSEAVKPLVGYMAQQFSLYGDLSVLENLNFFADLYNLSGPLRPDRIRQALEFSRLTEFWSRRAAHLSGGMQKKLSLACTLLHQPPILLLDEPTTGVDPVSRREFWDILAHLHLEGTTILVSTPYMDEAERCQRVGLMYAGRMVRCDTPSAIQRVVGGELLAFHPKNWRRARKALSDLPGVLEVQTYGEQLRIILDSVADRLPHLRQALTAVGEDPRGLRRVAPRMEEAFVSMIRRLEA